MDLVSFYQSVIAPPRPWKVVRVECFDDALRIDVWLEHEPSTFRCPTCMTECPTHDHAPERVWRHLDTCEFQTYIHARLPRVKCKNHGVLTAHVPFVTPQTSVTTPMETLCIKAMKECTLSGAETLFGVTARKLHRIQNLAVARGMERRGEETPVKMGLDEKQVFARHKYFTIITDLQWRKVVDVVDKRNIDAIAPWFEARSPSLKKTELVAMDMSAGYANIARKFMPFAEICFDKFHVIKLLNNAVDATRKDEQKTMDIEQKRKMFKSRFCFLYGKEKLDKENKEKFERASAVARKTARAWAIKEFMRDMWNLPPPEFEPQFKRWYWWATHSRLEHVVKVAKTLKLHLEGIVNAVLYGITNALTEGMNSKIEAIKRAASGYRNKQNFRNAILFHCGKLDMMPNLL
jgi:transposase